ncbi:MAG TPA: hypothetical protein VMS53_07520 [Burkholderiales bacterium]|nr:hypothetical protein [Burkholderiales bacterium]
MKCAWRLRPLLPLVLLFAVAGIGAQEEPGFDASQFERKWFELGGYVELKQEHFALNPPGAFYKLNYLGKPQLENLDRTTGTLQLVGKVRPGVGTFDFRTNSDLFWDQLGSDRVNTVYDAAYSGRPKPELTMEAGKRAMRWGKGYAWNPIGFVERPKDPNDPTLAREGYGMADADLIFSPGGDLHTIAFTPVVLPVSENLNNDFGASGHLNPAAKLYLLYRDTDIDFAWQGKGSRPARYGLDFSRNLVSNFEIHGEWARILDFQKPVTDASGQVTIDTRDATNWLAGLRYLTEGETTYIAEVYRNGTGYTTAESDLFYQLVDTAFATGNAALQQKALLLGQTSYGRPNPGQEYLYFRAQQKDALGIVYFQPAIFAIMNWQDRSYQVTPELQYTGITNLELRFRAFFLFGGKSTDFGEKQNSRKIEIYARYYF